MYQKSVAICKLANDLRHGWKHKYNIHDNCDADWCGVASKKKEKSNKQSCSVSQDIDASWNAGGRSEEDEDIFAQPKGSKVKLPTQEERDTLFQKIQFHGDKLAADAPGLIENESTNSVENKFSIRSRILPKSTSSTRAGGWHSGVGISLARVLFGPGYCQDVIKRVTSQEPTEYLQKFITDTVKLHQASAAHKQTDGFIVRRHVLKKRQSGVRSSSQKI